MSFNENFDFEFLHVYIHSEKLQHKTTMDTFELVLISLISKDIFHSV